jgi:hypothetical protein
LVGLPAPLDFDRLDWSQAGSVRVPTLLVHSRGDDEIPFQLTKEFSAAHPNVSVLETAPAPHGWEANVDPERFQSALTTWFTSPDVTSRS